MRRALITTLVVLGSASHAVAAVPTGFTQETYNSSDLASATGAAWAPDGSGRLFVLRKGGDIKVVRTSAGRPRTNPDGHLEVSNFATEPAVHPNSECGLLGIVFDPSYVLNHYLYVFVTVSASEQQIVRYTDLDGGVAAPGTGVDRTVILANLPTRGQNRDGGGLAIGGDGKLYFSIGDLGNGTGVDADLTSLASKVGRVNLDGTAPSDNPFNDGVGPNNELIWARGLRNPFGLFRQPSTGKLWTAVAGTAYEQMFLLERGAHAGYNDYENNQPAAFLTPKIAYRTNGIDTRNVVSAARAGGALTVTTTSAHGFRVGQSIELTSFAGAASFEGNVYVSSVPSSTSFTAAQAGADATVSGTGQANTRPLGGSITRGTFYDSTAFPTEYHGNLFFGDYNTGNVVRAVLSPTNEVQRVDQWGTGFTQNVQVVTGDDGALYMLGVTNGVLSRVIPTAPTPRLVVANTTPHVPEGGRAAIAVSLSTAPAANLTVTVARSSGDPDIDVLSGGTLTFTPSDWQQPRAVVLAAARDADAVPDVTNFDVSAPGLATEHVIATSIERSGPQLVLSADTVHVPEGGQATLTVAWSAPLVKETTVTIRRAGGDADLTVTGPTTLSFTPGNAQTPQTVTFAAADDADAAAGRAEIVVVSTVDVRAVELVEDDDDAPPPDAGTGDAGPADAGAKDAAAATGDASPPEEPTPTSPPPDASTEDALHAPEGGCGGCSVHGDTGTGAFWTLALGLLLRRRHRK
jgi:MYXO-CTERM domain-containing protein